MASMMAAMNPLGRINANDTSGSSGSTGGDGSTISANDFLTLLVTEMKNQDPTAQTDPNEYINQLVQVNSLEQLIQINQNLSTALGSPNPGITRSDPGSAPTGTGAPAAGAPSTNSIPVAQGEGRPQAAGTPGTLPQTAARSVGAVAGNLGVPKPTPAAERVAQALSGR